MKSRRHKGDSAPFSLFSFQDIITGISGIMIFVLLILSLELTMANGLPTDLIRLVPLLFRLLLFMLLLLWL